MCNRKYLAADFARPFGLTSFDFLCDWRYLLLFISMEVFSFLIDATAFFVPHRLSWWLFIQKTGKPLPRLAGFWSY